MGLAEAVADAIDILRGRPGCGGEGRDHWERMVAIIAENDSLPNSEVTRVEQAIDEIVTGSACRAIVPAGHRGQVGELWYVRVLPPPAPGIVAHVAFSTPYVLLKPGLAEWQAYFRRTLPEASQQARLDAYERHMKYGPTRTYWHDFVFEGYVNYRTEAIFLAGLPDVPESRPHSEVNN